MKAKVMNPETAAQRKARMKRVRSFKKTKSQAKRSTARKSRKSFIRRMKEISKPITAKKNPAKKTDYLKMRKAHESVSNILAELEKTKNVNVVFNTLDKGWLNYILRKI